MSERISLHGLQVDSELKTFIDEQVLPGTGVDSSDFWAGFDRIVHELSPKNAALLAERERLQSELDGWHRSHPGPIRDMPRWARRARSRAPTAATSRSGRLRRPRIRCSTRWR